jgi:hypothetical protein
MSQYADPHLRIAQPLAKGIDQSVKRSLVISNEIQKLGIADLERLALYGGLGSVAPALRAKAQLSERLPRLNAAKRRLASFDIAELKDDLPAQQEEQRIRGVVRFPDNRALPEGALPAERSVFGRMLEHDGCQPLAGVVIVRWIRGCLVRRHGQ